MQYKILGRTGLQVSNLGLGTAEIGFDYGIGPRRLPSEKEAISLLKEAVNLGITYLDTAYFYGLAEERIGKSGILANPEIVVTVKCGRFLEIGEDPRGQELEGRLRKEFETSLRNLGVEFVPILMLHGGSAEQIRRGELASILKKFREEGKTRFFGISTRGEEAPLAAIESREFEVIQTAYSILDQRMRIDVLQSALRNNVGVVCRSVFLKGALTARVSYLPHGLEPLMANSAKAKELAERLGIDLPTLAISFALDEPALSTILIGTNSIVNLRSAISASVQYSLKSETRAELRRLAIADVEQVDPARWPKII